MTTVADERSNSIVVSGTASDVRLMHDVIERLDAAVPEVRIEVVIAEVTLDDTNNSGLAALGLTFSGHDITNFSGSIPGWDVSSGTISPVAFQAALNATTAGGKSLVKIVQADVIMGSHAKQSEVTVGEEDPIINGSTETPTATGTTNTST